jgi:hypothetical protein
MFVELSPFQWALQHAQLLQWPTVAVVVYYFAKYLEHAKTVALKAADQINQLSTNHFPHMEASLTRQDGYLANIDKNIERLADKL